MRTRQMTRAWLIAVAAVVALAGGLAVTIPVTSAAAATPADTRTKAPLAASIVTSNIYNYNTNRCLGISSSSDAGIWNCTDAGGKSDQTWHWGKEVTGAWGIPYRQLINGKGQCLGIAGGSTKSGARIVGWRCLGPTHRDQYWYYDGVWGGQNGDGDVLVNLKTPCNAISQGGKVIGVAGGSKANGAAVVLWPSSLEPGAPFQVNQDWYLLGP